MESEEFPKKQFFRIQIPFIFRFALIWTIFFSVIGIIVHYLRFKSFSIISFFGDAYADWFESLLSLFSFNSNVSASLIFQGWYYFFITGGLVALLWALVEWIINLEFIFKRKQNEEAISHYFEQEQRKEVIPDEFSEFNESPPTFQKSSESIDKINEWLSEGLRMLSERNLEEAELIYKGIKQEYNPEFDSNGIIQRRILSFFEEIMAERSVRRKKK